MNSHKNKIIKYRASKIVIISIIFTLLSYVLINYIDEKQVYAADQYREKYTSSNNIDNYPGYRQLIENLRAQHPNWNFKIFYTGLDWNQVIKEETSAYHGRNVVPASKPSAWKCASCGETPRGGSSWRCASEAAVSYYMDPRNWLNDTYIFQFENLSYNDAIQNIDGVKKIIDGMNYMNGEYVTYVDTSGNVASLNKSWAQVIMEAAQEAGISPYHLASRLRQEQGAGNSPGSTATGTYPGYVGYYNFMNIKASGSTDSEVIANGLTHAKNKGWTNPEISIKEGAKVLASNYINDGQDTLYLQKYDVDGSDGYLYSYQYMQNASAAVTEGVSVRNTYEKLGLLDSSIEFTIPVYENMPDTICPEPSDGSIVTQNIKIKGTNVNVRNGNNTSSSIIATVNTGDTLLRIQTASTTNDGYYWDKIVLPDGTKGYVVRNYIVETPDITNCNEQVVANTSVNLRNGPGTTGTTVITTLIQGQMLTRIATGEYNGLNGYNWDRVQLTDGRQGYIASCYIDKVGENGNNNTNPNTNTYNPEIVKVICNSGVKLREQPGINSRVVTYLDKNDEVTRTEAEVSNANGYIWDKVVTSDGIEGYIARGDSTEDYIEVIRSANNNNNNTNPEPSNGIFKIENSNLVCVPQTTIENIKEKYSNKSVTVKDSNGNDITSGNIGTGATITVDGTTYTVIKKGDVNGDGDVKATDYMTIKNYIMGTSTGLSQAQIAAADVNKDSDIKATDYMTIKNYIMNGIKIDI